MLRWIIGTSLRARGFVVVIAAGIMVFGAVHLRDMPRETLPEFSPPTVQIQTEALGLSAIEVEELITVPLEQDLLNGVAFVETIRSESIPGLSSIEMVFESGTDILDARQVVQERLTQAHALPQVSKPPQMLQPIGSTSRVMMIGLSSDDVSLIDMSLLARWNIRPRLMGVPGVANVSVWGQRERQLQVLVDPERLHANGVTLHQMIETAANAQFVSNLTFVEASTPGTGGIIETPTQRFGVQHAVPFASPADLAKVIIEGTEDHPLRLGEVADIRIDHQLLIGDAVLAGHEGLLLVVEKLPGVSALDVTRDVEAALDDLRPGLSGIAIDPSIFRPATFIESANSNMTIALVVGIVLMLIVLGALLFDPRTAVVCVVSIVASLLAAVAVLSLFDTTLNAMVVAGLVMALVVIVDQAVGDVGNVVARLRLRAADGDTTVRSVVFQSAVEMRSAELFALLIALASIVPVLFTTGAFGAFFPTTAGAYAVAVSVAMVVALAVTPAVGLLLLSDGAVRRESPVVRWLGARYERGLPRFASSLRPAMIVAAVLLVSGLCTFPFLERTSTPTFADTDLLVRLAGPSGTSLPEMDRVAHRVADEIGGLPGVLDVGGHSGRAILSDQVVGTGASELWVDIDPEADYDATRASIERVVTAYPGLERDVLTYPAERIEQILPSPGAPVTVRVFGPDLPTLTGKAEEIRQAISGIDGIVDPVVQAIPQEPTLDIEVDLDAAARHGIVPGEVRRAAAALLSGIQVGSLFDEQKVFDVVVWGTPEVRNDLSAVEDLAIDTVDGGQIRLGDVADVHVASSPSVIRHVDVSRSIDVTAGVDGRDLGAVLADVRTSIDAIDFPLEYHTELIEEFSKARADDRQAFDIAIGAAIAILLLLQAGLGNWRIALASVALLPIALSGGALAAWLDGGVVSIGSIAGFFAVFAVTSRQMFVVTRHLQLVERRPTTTSVEEAVRLGIRECFASILTSAGTIAVLVAPLAFTGAIAGLEIVQPMATVVLGGILTSSLVVLFVLPALYQRFGSGAEVNLSTVLADRTIDLTALEETELTSP